MSSINNNQDNQVHTNDASTTAPSVIPLVAATAAATSSQNKRQTLKQKLRVRPIRSLQKNTQRKVLPSAIVGLSSKTTTTPVAAGAASVNGGSDDDPKIRVITQPISTSTTTTTVASNDNANSNTTNEGHFSAKQQDGLMKSSTMHKRSMLHSSLPLRTTATTVNTLSSNVRKGQSIIHVGSAMISNSKKQSSSLHHVAATIHQGKDKDSYTDEIVDPSTQSSSAAGIETKNHLPSIIGTVNDDDDDENEIPDSTAQEDASSNNQIEITPYQHLGLIDPSLNIAPPKPNEKTMKDFCSKFKLPKSSKGGNSNGGGGGGGGGANGQAGNNGGSSGNHPVVHRHTNTSDENEMRDQRSGPLVEIINGEIVIQESSIIVGGRKTTEEVDRELEGGIIEEENTALTATYTSFTNREKVKRWTVDETKKFYLALRQCGTDFSTMENFFDGTDGGKKRSRKELKCKYNRESRKHPKLIDMAMDPKVQLPYDLSVFGELDMEAVVVGRNKTGDGVVLPKDSQTPISVTPASSVVTMVNHEEEEQGGKQEGEEENSNAQEVVVSQQTTHAMDVECMNNDNNNNDTSIEKEAIGAVVEAGDAIILDETTKEDTANKHLSSIPLLAPGAAKKKKMKPKFRAKPNAVNAKGAMPPKRIVK
mmetsp:Transcript_11398/g.21327  ORF Transcript_11398/g.21327 Transcript_11398/m.21327 type:complete len:649 (+) Transcript_11398:26-1972(+)